MFIIGNRAIWKKNSCYYLWLWKPMNRGLLFTLNKTNPGLWCVLGHGTHELIAYAFDPRTHAVLFRLLKLLSPLNITHWFTDGLNELFEQTKHFMGKRNTQNIEHFFLTRRTRIKSLARRTIYFSKSAIMHDTVIGLFINRYCFGQNV